MNGYNSGTEPCWMPLMELIETCLFDIIHTEDTTGRFIRLYGAGDYWHAFEESAYQLSQLFVTHDVTVLRHKVYPFPVLMVSISDDELQAYGKNHIFRKEVPCLKNNVWVGPNVIIAGPVVIEDDVVIAGNSFVNRSVPKGAIVAGCPAKIIGWRKNLDYAIETNPKYKDGRMPFLTK
ncbi:acyltransferase [Alistipes shahii]|uniref:acyltransferase n=1 Tax=Alistipes shahii TaxID=328814 RepID=UPI001E5CF310|nr:hypothetical protein [Alistipes shahii]